MGNNATTVSLQDHDGRGSTDKAHGSAAGIESCKKKGSQRLGMIPDPQSFNEENGAMVGSRKGKKSPPLTNGVQIDEEGLVIPRKPANPCMESSERQNLHRELLFNQKIGKSVLGQKSELQKAMEKFRDDQKKKELVEEKEQTKSAFEKKLEEQANKLKQQEESEAKKSDTAPVDQPEFLRVHARVCAQTIEPTT